MADILVMINLYLVALSPLEGDANAKGVDYRNYGTRTG